MAAEKFDYEGVKAKMGELEDLFERFAKRLSEINMYINENVNVGSSSALFGEAGYGVLATWNENASTFGDFKANFDKWSQLVTIVQMNNMELEGELFRSTGSSMSGVQESRAAIAEEMAKEEVNKFVYSDESFRYMVTTTNEGTTIVKYDMAGVPISSVTTRLDENGNVVEILKTAGIVTTCVIAADGSVLSKIDEKSNGYRRVTDENGNVYYENASGVRITEGEFNNAPTTGSFLSDIASYNDSGVSTYHTSSVVQGISGTAQSVVETGTSFSMSSGTTVLGPDGQSYKFAFMVDGGNLSGTKYFVLNDGSSLSGNTIVYGMTSSGEIVACGSCESLLRVMANDGSKPVTTVRIVNDNLNVTNLVVENGSQCWAVSREYVAETEGYLHNVGTIAPVNHAITNQRSFTIADNKQLYETDWSNSTTNSNVFYNPTADAGIKSNYYYVDENNDGFVSINEDWTGNDVHGAINKAVQRGDNKKYTGGEIFELRDTTTGSN